MHRRYKLETQKTTLAFPQIQKRRVSHITVARSERATARDADFFHMPGSRDELIKAFEAFDCDGSGALSATELVAILTRPGGAAPMSVEAAQDLIKMVDANGDGELQLAEFLDLMATPGALTMLPAPPTSAEDRKKAFDTETATVKKSSPVKKLFERVHAHDAELTALNLNVQENDNMVNMEWRMWPDTRKAAALALLAGNPVITKLNLAGCSLNDTAASALAACLGAGSKVEVLNLERNGLTEVGLKPIIAAFESNETLKELKLTGQSQNLSSVVEVALAELLDSGKCSTLVKIGPPMRNPNERRRVEAALSRNMDLQRKKRKEAAAQQAAQ
jgi:hypothetical protein